MKQNRRLPPQQEFTPANTYSSDQEQPSSVTNQQYNQPLTQQPRTSYNQPPLQKNMFRFFQTPSRIANNYNTQSTSSSFNQ